MSLLLQSLHRYRFYTTFIQFKSAVNLSLSTYFKRWSSGSFVSRSNSLVSLIHISSSPKPCKWNFNFVAFSTEYKTHNYSF